NAVKFTEEGHIFVGVDFEGETGQSVSLRFTVRDTGIGISDAQLSKIFDKFTQADASTTRQYGGSGLGLTITRQLVELMGGTLSVKSSLGRGSSFGFGLKLDLHRELIEEPVKAADLKGVKILIVDDIAVTGRVLTEQLTLWGMRPFTSDSGVSAISALRRARESDDPFRMAIVDFHMPGMDGMSLGRIVKEDPGLKDTALIFASSVGHRGDAKEVREAGFSAYLVKPIRPSILLEVLNSIWSAASEGKTPEFATRYTLGEPITRPVQPVSKPFQDGPQFDMKVLIAEDNTVNLVVAENLLKMFGCKVETAANGLLALKALQQTTFDLVFMDCQMPEMDGYNATRRIRDLESDVRNIPIIAMTAHAMETDRQACLDAGMNDHITKPLTDKDFLRILQKFSNRQPPQAPSAAGGSIDIERWRYLATMTGSYDATFAASLIDAFTEETPRKMQELRDTIASGNTSDIEDAAHALTGSGANIGAMKFSELAEQIELDAESGVVENADRLFGDLRKELKQVIQDLEGLRDG
ncbi:MAG: response regulator, partial [Planctomycetota bacterium]|nr:response regulator [Planctomycetota bacterium]